MKTLAIDIETYSTVDLNRTGVYRYSEDPGFEILLFGYSADGGEVQVVDLARGEEIPGEILAALTDDTVIKTAFNANFERVCLSRYLERRGRLGRGEFLSPRAWRCTMVWSAYLGLPMSLAGVGAVLHLEKQKMEAGRDLIRYFCLPQEPATWNGNRERNRPEDAPGRWETFVAYNRRDVETEREIAARLSRYPMPDFLWEQYWQDQEINDRGILLDAAFVEKANQMKERIGEELSRKMKELTKIANPKSIPQMKKWLSEKGMETESLAKKEVKKMMDECPEELREALKIRLQLTRSSVKKYEAMRDAACADGRARGMFQFYGAARTGRFSGRLIQMQNLPKNELEDLDGAREMVLRGDEAGIKAKYGDVTDVLSQLLRTAFIAPEGKVFLVADYSAIEARILAWLAGEKWRTELFARGGDIYCGSAEKMFKVKVEKNGENGHLRAKGKIAELALGYGGAVGALRKMGAVEMGLTENELESLVTAWRWANPHIKHLWDDVGDAALAAVDAKATTWCRGIAFSYRSGALFIRLPSGRMLSYMKPVIVMNQYKKRAVTYLGSGEGKVWDRVETYGPKLCENIVQGIARDVLCEAMGRVRGMKGIEIVAHVHDEIVAEATEGTSVDELCDVMGRPPEWASGLLLRADGFTTKYYCK